MHGIRNIEVKQGGLKWVCEIAQLRSGFVRTFLAT